MCRYDQLAKIYNFTKMNPVQLSIALLFATILYMYNIHICWLWIFNTKLLAHFPLPPFLQSLFTAF